MVRKYRKRAGKTETLIPNITDRVKCYFGETDYCLLQFITEHRRFKSYTSRMGIANYDYCRYCGLIDMAEHIILMCEKCNTHRSETERQIGRKLSAENITEIMIRQMNTCKTINEFI